MIPYSKSHRKTRRKDAIGDVKQREYSSIPPQDRKGPFKVARKFAEQELKALVDYYGVDEEPIPESEPSDEGSLVWNVGNDHVPWPLKDPKDHKTIEHLQQVLQRDGPSHDDIFATYQELPEPRVVYLESSLIRDMLHCLSIVERPTPLAMQRYLSILDDMKNAHIHISRSEWTTAMHFAGRSMSGSRADDLQSALYLWRDMEQRANVKASFVTFNVLFVTAVKAGKFTLAELFLKEMQTRGLRFHRHFRVSLIYYHGVMQNGSGIRRVYQEMVAAGDVVDVVVMNAVIAALFRAGEPSAAEHVFERMKRLAATGSTSTAPFVSSGGLTFTKNERSWRRRRQLGLHLTHEGRRLKDSNDTDSLKQLQEWAPIAPNSRTYSLLIRHHAISIGNLDRVNDFLREMGYNGVLLEGSIFFVIFHGFAAYGGVRYTSWTRTHLEQTWEEFKEALGNELERTWIDTTSAIAVLKAYKKCTDAERTMAIWEELKELWVPGAKEEEAVTRVLRDLIPMSSSNLFD